MAKAEISPSGELKKTKFADKSIDNGKLSIAFGNGEVVSVALDEIPEELHTDLAMHGLSQKLGDSYAGAKGDYAMAIKNVTQVIEQLKAGDWRASRGSGESKPRVGELAAAVARVKSISVEEAMAILDTLDDEAKKTVRNHAQIKLAIQQIRTEKAVEAAKKAGDLTL